MNCYNSGVNVTKSVAVLKDIELSGPKFQTRYTGEDMTGKQLGKFSSAKDGRKQKYVQVLRGLLF